MAVKIKETKIKLKSFFRDESTDGGKTKIFTINDIDPAASNENLYSLASSLNPLIEGNFFKAVKGKDETLSMEA